MVNIRVCVPESLAGAFLAFFDSKRLSTPAVIKSPSHEKNEPYFIELNLKTLSLYYGFLSSGLSVKASISAVNKQLKVLGFYNTTYDMVKLLLTRHGCFKSIPA